MPAAHEYRAATDARLVRVVPLCTAHVLLECVSADFPSSSPGQFLQVQCAPPDDHRVTSVKEWPADGFPSMSDDDFTARRPYLRRPFSIADRWDDVDGLTHLCVISRAVGVGTDWLAQRRAGESLSITGPLGHGFVLPDDDRPLLLIGGGVGIPPFLYLARVLAAQQRSGVTIILGATTATLLPVTLRGAPDPTGVAKTCVVYPGGGDYPTIVASDDGSIGLRGRVTDALERWTRHSAPPRTPPLVLACGPEAMLRALADATRRYGFECQLCIERNMGCGLGACLSCIVRRRDPERPSGWRWALACSDGPVFARDDLLDYSGSRSA
jgi:dihydroorotate dehydrogenase electron transfer subunit